MMPFFFIQCSIFSLLANLLSPLMFMVAIFILIPSFSLMCMLVGCTLSGGFIVLHCCVLFSMFSSVPLSSLFLSSCAVSSLFLVFLVRVS